MPLLSEVVVGGRQMASLEPEERHRRKLATRLAWATYQWPKPESDRLRAAFDKWWDRNHVEVANSN